MSGLSFKKGLMKLNASTDADMLYCFTLPPCDVNVALKQLKKDRYFLIALQFVFAGNVNDNMMICHKRQSQQGAIQRH